MPVQVPTAKPNTADALSLATTYPARKPLKNGEDKREPSWPTPLLTSPSTRCCRRSSWFLRNVRSLSLGRESCAEFVVSVRFVGQHVPKHARTRESRRASSSALPQGRPYPAQRLFARCQLAGPAVSGAERLGLWPLQLRRSRWAESTGQQRLCWARIICWPSFWSTAMVCTEGPVGRTKSRGEMRDEGRLPEVQTPGGGGGWRLGDENQGIIEA